MGGQLLQNGKQSFVDANGRPLVSGRVYFYSPGTQTLRDTWQDVDLTVLNTNPIILDARGEASIYGSGDYRQVLRDSSGVLIWDQLLPDQTKTVAANVAYTDPYGAAKVVQDMSGDQGAALIGFKQSGTNTVKRDLYKKVQREIELGDYLSGGADDTVQLQNMLADIPNKTTKRMISIGGLQASFSGTTPRVIVRAGDLTISSTLTLPPYLDLLGEETIITLNSILLDIFSGEAYQWSIEGFNLVGGRHQIDFYNSNTNSSMVYFGHMHNFLCDARAYNSRATGTNAATGQPWSHLSMDATIFKTRIIGCKQAVNNCCDSMTIKDSWIEPKKANMAPSTAVMINRGATVTDPNAFTRLKIQDTFLIPDIGVQGVDRVDNVRWVDNYGSFVADHCRFGGENGGMSILWQHGAPNASQPWNVTEAIFRDSTLYSGPDSRADSCVVSIQGQVPNRITVKSCVGHLGNPLIANSSSTDLPAYFTAFENASGKKAYEYFKIDVDSDINDLAFYTPLRPTIPNGLYPYLIKGRRTLVRKQNQTLANGMAVNLVSFDTITADNLGAFVIATPTRLNMPNGCSKMTVSVSTYITSDGTAKTISVDIVDSGGTLVDGVTSLCGAAADIDRINATFHVEGPPSMYWSIRIRHNAAGSLNMADCKVKAAPTDQVV